MKIPFNIPYISGNEVTYINEVIQEKVFSSPGKFSRMCEEELSKLTGCKEIRLTTSCTSALELSALAIGLKPEDEVIIPSYTFVSSANAFALRGANLVFVDINPKTMCLDETLLEKALTKKTKAVVLVHYAGLAENIEKIVEFCKKNNLFLIEDAAQSIDSYCQNKHLGTFGDVGCLSFHDTKNIHCGEGGAILINNSKLVEKIDIILEKGTDRKKFLEGKISTYSWKSLGSSYGLSEINAAFLYGQLQSLKSVTNTRKELYSLYQKGLQPLKEKGLIDFPEPTNNHNAHIFFIKVKNIDVRDKLISNLSQSGVSAYFHYSPLHLSDMGIKYKFISSGNDFSKIESERVVRLPLFYGLEKNNVELVCNRIKSFFEVI
ncbi:MAG: dTDP-4-amino-4,6-dideoxygalactose transaminase [Flavobacteriales bacterium]|nr:dTDP-4-amino-4,6-dideoxygalactose transaminase [Flavobacteriales bacterium]MCB9173013.1 dTDP-4-amino-4,6-dideoxygalactose transaminase [Flavobacteriales bacterium]